MNLKSILKSIKMHESSISTVLGFVIIVIIGLLIVNYFRQANNGDTLPDAGSIAENQLSQNSHKVASGETLWSIAEKHYGTGFEWTRIAEANNLQNADSVEEGQVLTIPEIKAEETSVASASPSATPAVITTAVATATPEPQAPVVTTPETPSVKSDSYTVVHGDNLWKIAEKAYGDGYKWTEIAGANKLVNPGVIHAGNVLVLPR